MIPGIVAWRSPTVGPDPYWANVVLLQRFDGSSLDLKGHAFTNFGSPSYATGKFNQALTLSAVSAAGVYAASGQSDFVFGTGDFTVEAWIKPDLDVPSGGCAVISLFDIAPQNGWQVYVGTDGRLFWYQYATGSGSYPVGPVGPDLRGAWHHFEVNRIGTTLRAFVDGVLVGSVTNSINYNNLSYNLSIGYQHQGSARYPFKGQIDEVRITKGVGRHSANFTVINAPFPNY